VLLNVSSLVIPQLRKDIIIIALFFTATSLTPMSHLFSPFPISLLLLLWVTLPLSLMSCLLRYLFCLYLSLPLLLRSCCLHVRLLHFGSICAGHTHQLLHLYHHHSRLRIQCLPLHRTPYPLPSGKVNVLAPLNIQSASLSPLVLYLLHFLALFPIYLLFPFQRQCGMPYRTLVGGKLWNWK